MGEAIGPGDWVECLRESEDTGFAIGAVYRVSDAQGPMPCECTGQCLALSFDGMPSGHRTGGWAGCCFRPIYRPKSSFIESLQHPAPQEREDA